MKSTLNIAISEPIREKYVQIFSLQQNISEMSVKSSWEKTSSPLLGKRRDRGKEGRKVKRKLENSGGRERERKRLLWAERGVKEGMVRARERGWGLGLSCQKCWPIPTLASLDCFPSYCRPTEPQRPPSVSPPTLHSAGPAPRIHIASCGTVLLDCIYSSTQRRMR